MLNSKISNIILIIYILYIGHIRSIALFNKGQSDEDVSFALEKMTNQIVSEYFSNLRCILLVVEKSRGAGFIENSIPIEIQRFNVHMDKHETNYTIMERIMLKALNDRCLGYIFMVSDPIQAVLSFNNMCRQSHQRPNRRLLILPTQGLMLGTQPEAFGSPDDVLNMREMDFFPDLVIARFGAGDNDTKSTSIELVTHKFSGKFSFRQQVILDVWIHSWVTNEGRFQQSSNLYPDKVANLMGKSLTISTFTYPPYAILDTNATPPVFDGTETRIILEFLKRINATYNISVDAENEWGEIYENFTGNGILGSIAEDRGVLGYGAIYLWSYEYQFVDFSIPYIRTGITCIAPRPHQLPGWLTPILPFTLTLWSAVGVSILAAALSLYFITKAIGLVPSTETRHNEGRYSTLWDCIFDSLGLLVLQTPPDERTSASRITGPNRHVLVWLTIMFLLITTSYSSGLASVLTVPRFQPPIETVRDLAYSNIPWAASHVAWIFSLREAQDPQTILLTSHFQAISMEELRKHAIVGDIAFSIERLSAGHYAVGEYIHVEDVSKRLRLMKQDIYSEYVPTITRKGSPYMEKMNKLILRLVDSGIILKWEDQVVSRFLPTRVQHAITHSRRSAPDDSTPTKLQLKHIQGGLYLLALGLIFSFFAFIVELTSIKFSSRQRK